MDDQYDVGEIVTLTGEFVRTSDGALVDPITLALTIVHADGTTVVKAIGDLVHVAAGQFTYDVTALAAGVLTHTWVAAGNGVDSSRTEYVIVGYPDHDGPCDLWCDPSDVFDCRPASAIAEGDRDYDQAADMVAAASRILFLLSDRRYPGICEDTSRPCRRSVWAAPGGYHSSWGACGCDSLSACGCGGISEVRLGADYPILGVLQVRVDGAIVSPAAYRIDDWGWLVRTDGDVWPSTQDLAADPASDPSTFDVRYVYGRRPAADAVMAAKRYASELYTGCAGAAGCSLPKRIQEISRRGETIAFLDPQEFLENGLTGIAEVDAWITAERYGSSHLGTVVASPDFVSGARRTTG